MVIIKSYVIFEQNQLGLLIILKQKNIFYRFWLTMSLTNYVILGFYKFYLYIYHLIWIIMKVVMYNIIDNKGTLRLAQSLHHGHYHEIKCFIEIPLYKGKWHHVSMSQRVLKKDQIKTTLNWWVWMRRYKCARIVTRGNLWPLPTLWEKRKNICV